MDVELISQPLTTTGPLEVTRAATAFNLMQQRIADHLGERMRILAAISHDLQTPITRMRLRCELLDDSVLKDKLTGDLDAMQALVQEGIVYARDSHGITEAPHRTDLDALLDSLVCDYSDAGNPIKLTGRLGRPCMTCPNTLRRIITNLLDNALKFGRDTEIDPEIAIRAVDNERVVITVSDRGPGIPEAELAAVMQPFYRVDNSRNRETGGAGLGLAIARQLSLALGGGLRLANRQGGGLQVELSLPLWIDGEFRPDQKVDAAPEGLPILSSPMGASH